MVCLIELIKKLRDELLCQINLDKALYNFYNKKKIIKIPYDETNLVLKIAFAGYSGEINDTFQLDSIDSHQKQNNYKNKFAQCMGVRLYTDAAIELLLSDFNRFDVKRKYIMSKIFPQLRQELEKYLSNDNTIESNFIKLLVHKEVDVLKIQDIEFEYFAESNISDMIDLMILEDYMKMYALSAYKKDDPKELIIEILNNYSNSIKWITQNRNKGKQIFDIKDEYDVQDTLCMVLQSVFPDCEKEDPSPKDAQGLYHRIDLVIHSLGIYIEVKMIKEQDIHKVKEFKKQIDEDIIGYSSNNDLKHLIFFTYDPNGYADNEQHFKGCQSEVKNSGITYSIDKVYQK